MEKKENNHPISPETQQKIFNFFMKTSAPRLYEKANKREEGEQNGSDTGAD